MAWSPGLESCLAWYMSLGKSHMSSRTLLSSSGKWAPAKPIRYYEGRDRSWGHKEAQPEGGLSSLLW